MSIKKFVIPTALAGSLVASLVVFTNVGSASAGTGASQNISTVLRLVTPSVANVLHTCLDIEFEDPTMDPLSDCTDQTLLEAKEIETIELALDYAYQPGRVESVPDVATQSGKLNLPAVGTESAHACHEKTGAALVAQGGGITSSGYNTGVTSDGSRTQGPAGNPTTYKSPVKSVRLVSCLERPLPF